MAPVVLVVPVVLVGSSVVSPAVWLAEPELSPSVVEVVGAAPVLEVVGSEVGLRVASVALAWIYLLRRGARARVTAAKCAPP